MKRVLSIISFSFVMLLLMAVPQWGWAQDPCQITCDVVMPVCSQSAVTLSVPNNYLYRYQWTPGDYTTNSITVKPLETTLYHVYVTDTAGVAICDDTLTIRVRPRFQSDIQQLKLTCTNSDNDNGNTAQIQASASGSTGQFTYSWVDIPNYQQVGEDKTTAIGLKAHQWYYVDITDLSCNCTQRDSIFTHAFPTADIVISCDPGDSVFIQNPDLTFSFENNSDVVIDHYFWTFEHDITSTQSEPTFTYAEYKSGTYEATLTVYDDCGCDTTYTKELHVMPVELSVPSVFTPNGDGYNDTFVITLKSGSETPGNNSDTRHRDGNNSGNRPLSDYYKSTDLVVFNRWGRIVYHSTDYQNDWDGGGLSDGTYFYVLKCKGLKEVVQYEGVVMILTKSR